MPIGKVLLLKALGGLTALGGAIGGAWYIYNLNNNLDTKFDRGLIEFLDEGGNIQFSVKNGSDADISTNFPEFSSTTPPTATVTIKVSVSTATEGTNDGTLTDKSGATDGAIGTKKYLQKLNGSGDGTAWTWECKLEFKKVGDTNGATSLKEEEKKKVFNESEPKGLLNKLKDEDTENKHKDLKKEFIKNCAAARGKDKNKKIDELTSLTVTDKVITTANKIESTKTFELVKDNTNLVPKDQSDFNSWFGITNN